LEAISDVLKFFEGKRETNLREEFVFEELFAANVSKLYDEYGYVRFGLDIDWEAGRYSDTRCPWSICWSRSMRRVDGHLASHPTTDLLTREGAPEGRPYLLVKGIGDRRPGASSTNPIRTDIPAPPMEWSKYVFDEVRLPSRLCASTTRLRELEASPVLPQGLLELLTEYRRTINHNVHLLRTVVTELAPEFPERYPDEVTLKNADWGWIHRKYITRFEHLEPPGQAILEWVRKHIRPDHVLHA
jgi:hypothetical protein